MHLLIVAALLLVVLPASAIDPWPGDLFVVENGGAYHVDARTGDRTIVSCWGQTTTHCPGGVELGNESVEACPGSCLNRVGGREVGSESRHRAGQEGITQLVD